jgi:tetratricopeptide (TPR) repeat protein
MRLYEKILIGLVLLLFGTQLLPDFTGKGVLFGLATGLLALSYLIGGYWLLNPKDNRKYFIPIVAGLAFATSLSTLPFTIRISKETVFEILPLLNVGLFLGLGIYLLIKLNAKNIVKNYKGVFIRSATILTVVGFFSYTPVSFKPYRYILIALNNGNDYLIENMQMFNYKEESEDALESGDCERAIKSAEKANEAGKAWLGISTVEDDNSQKSELWKISGTFSNLYKAYKCKADEHYENNDYEKALSYYLKADKALNACDHNSEYWDIEQAYSLNLIALCYKKLYNYEYADSLFVEAIEKYQAVKDTTDRNVAIFYSNLAESMAEQLQFGYSNLLYKASIIILQRDTINEENKKDIIENYHNLIKNHLQADSLEQAMYFIEETFKRVDKTTVDFCNTNLYYGLCFHKLSKYKRADEVLTECLDCYKKLLEPTNQNIAENHLALAQVKIALAEYDLAKNSLDNGIEITTKNYGNKSARYANYLKAYAHLNKEIGNYEKSEQEYYQVLEIYIDELGERNRKLPEVLSGLADLEIVLAKFGKAKAHSDSSISIASYFIDLENSAVTSLINNAAYVNYYIGLYDVSDSLYKKTININMNYGLQSTSPTAIALNGLGLVMTAKRKYKTADSLFVQTLKLHKEIFTDNHPFTAVVYLNYANLKIKENKLEQAKEMLNKSLDINKKFYKQEHDIFADIYVAYGYLAEKERLRDKSRDYYQKALEIYIDKFDEGHIRVKSTRDKLKD